MRRFWWRAMSPCLLQLGVFSWGFTSKIECKINNFFLLPGKSEGKRNKRYGGGGREREGSRRKTDEFDNHFKENCQREFLIWRISQSKLYPRLYLDYQNVISKFNDIVYLHFYFLKTVLFLMIIVFIYVVAAGITSCYFQDHQHCTLSWAQSVLFCLEKRLVS